MKPKVELALRVSTYDGRPPRQALTAQVAGDTCAIGRDASCQLTLPDPGREVSGQHVLIYRQDGGFAVIDVSRNGTLLNDAEEPLDPSQPVELYHGDRLTIGRYVVEIGFVPAPGTPMWTAQTGETSLPPEEAPSESAFPDILDYINADATLPAIEAPSQRGTPLASSGERRLTAASAALDNPAGEVITERVPAISAHGNARSETPPRATAEDTQAQEAMPQQTPRPAVSPSVPDPADAPTMLVALADGPARGGEAMGRQQVASPQLPASGLGAGPEVGDRAPAGAVSSPAGAEATDAPTRIPRIMGPPSGVAAGSCPPAAHDAASGDREPSARAQTEAAAVPSDARQDPTPPQALETSAENPASGAPDPGHAFDPGRTMEGPSCAAKLDRAPVLDNATRIRSAVEAPSPRPLSPSERTLVEAFLAGLGAGHPDEIGDVGRLMHTSGKLLRALTQGLVTVTMTQGRFGSEPPPIPPGAVNPFCFRADLEETLARVLWRPGWGDLDACLAARQAFEDLEVHQAALRAGFHAVMKALLARLEPHAIEQEVEGRVGLSQLRPNARKAKCWESYIKSFEEVADDLAEDFPKLMGDVFGHAYDDHVERLRETKQRR